jgi:hypothetical protein
MLGHGMIGIGTAKSRSIKKRQFVSSSGHGANDFIRKMFFFSIHPSKSIDNEIEPLISGHVGTTVKAVIGSIQSRMGGGGSLIEQSDTKSKSTLGIDGTLHLLSSNSGCVMKLPAIGC